MKTVVLGVSGSVACYRACDIARELMRNDCRVRVCLTHAASKFVSPSLFEALTGQPCLVSAFDEPEQGRMAHIDWAREADVVTVAPATANILNKLANGYADDMLTTLALAYDGPTVVAPAMNPTMFGNETTQASLRAIEARGASIVWPQSGDVACGENGQGKLAAVQDIVDATLGVLARSKTLVGKTVLITSGPTQEPIDDVRFLSNRSSGKMGAALARAALDRGASVVLVTGPTNTVLPSGATLVWVRTAREMLAAAMSHVGNSDLIFGAAAVSDFSPAMLVSGKIRKADGLPTVALVVNPDIIAELAKAAPASARVIAFAAEPNPDLEVARRKLEEKGVYAVAHNDVSDAGIGFESDDNELMLVTRDREVRSPRAPKIVCAHWLLEQTTLPN